MWVSILCPCRDCHISTLPVQPDVGCKSSHPLINLVMINMFQLRTLAWVNTEEGKRTPGVLSKTRWLKGSVPTAHWELSYVAAFARQLPTTQMVISDTVAIRDPGLKTKSSLLSFSEHFVNKGVQLCSDNEAAKSPSHNLHLLPWQVFIDQWRSSTHSYSGQMNSFL